MTSRAVTPLERHLAWDGCANVRDLGGHPTVDGRTTQFRRVVRADLIRRLSDAGWEALVGYGVARIVDLRDHDELAADPPRELPVELEHVPLLGGANDRHAEELERIAASAESPAGATAAVYLHFLESSSNNFAQAIGTIADAPPGCVLVHCVGGKDRTGLVVALLLSLAGVPRDEIAADYAISERNLAERTARWLAAAEDDLERARRRRIAACPPDAMRQVLDELDRRYGGIREFLIAAGASEETPARAAARLLAA